MKAVRRSYHDDDDYNEGDLMFMGDPNEDKGHGEIAAILIALAILSPILIFLFLYAMGVFG